MSYITEIFERADLQQIREFLMNGAELLQTTNKTYKQRLADGMEQAIQLIHTHFSEDYERIENSIVEATAIYGEVYMEIGLQVGIKLAMQILNLNM